MMAAQYSFRTVLEARREILEQNIPYELSARLIEKGILEPSDQEKLKCIRDTNGSQECRNEFTRILIERSWIEAEVQELKECLEDMNETFLVKKLYKEPISEPSEPMESEGGGPRASREQRQTGGAAGSITVIGDGNTVTSGSTVTYHYR